MKIELFNQDCINYMQSLPDSSVDLIYADPPYDYDDFSEGTGGTVNDVMKLDKTLKAVNEVTQTQYDLPKFCKEAIRVCKDINIYIWCNKRQIFDYMKIFVGEHKCLFDILVWNKTNALPTYSNKYLTDCEYCLYFHSGPGKCFPQTYQNAKTVFTSPINRENKKYGHPNIKPIEFVTAHILNSSKVGDTILDPYMGSGTAGKVCKTNQRNYIGLEINKKWFDVATHRIHYEGQPKRLF